MIKITNKSVLNRLIVIVVLHFVVLNAHALNSGTTEHTEVTSIPFKKDNSTIESASSKVIIISIFLLVLAASIFFISRKYSLNLWQRPGADVDQSIKLVRVKRLTSNSLILQINIDGKTFTFLESKFNIKQINTE